MIPSAVEAPDKAAGATYLNLKNWLGSIRMRLLPEVGSRGRGQIQSNVRMPVLAVIGLVFTAVTGLPRSCFISSPTVWIAIRLIKVSGAVVTVRRAGGLETIRRRAQSCDREASGELNV